MNCEKLPKYGVCCSGLVCFYLVLPYRHGSNSVFGIVTLKTYMLNSVGLQLLSEHQYICLDANEIKQYSTRN